MNPQSDRWFLIRNNLSETAPGESSDDVSHSPDIIIADGATIDPRLIQDYSNDVSQEIKYGEDNHIYVRAKNLGTGLAKGNVSVYATHLTNLPEPRSWLPLTTQGGDRSIAIAAKGSAIDGTDTPFLWSKLTAPAPGAPYCVIAVISDPTHPRVFPPQSVKDQASFDSWICEQSNMAYRIFEAVSKPASSNAFCSWTGLLQLNNPTQESITIQVTCVQSDPGAQIEFKIDQPDTQGSVIGLGPVVLVPSHVYSVTPTVSANFVAKIKINYSTPSPESAKGVTFNLKVSTASPGNSDGGDLGDETVTVLEEFDVTIVRST